MARNQERLSSFDVADALGALVRGAKTRQWLSAAAAVLHIGACALAGVVLVTGDSFPSSPIFAGEENRRLEYPSRTSIDSRTTMGLTSEFVRRFAIVCLQLLPACNACERRDFHGAMEEARRDPVRSASPLVSVNANQLEDRHLLPTLIVTTEAVFLDPSVRELEAHRIDPDGFANQYPPDRLGTAIPGPPIRVLDLVPGDFGGEEFWRTTEIPVLERTLREHRNAFEAPPSFYWVEIVPYGDQYVRLTFSGFALRIAPEVPWRVIYPLLVTTCSSVGASSFEFWLQWGDGIGAIPAHLPFYHSTPPSETPDATSYSFWVAVTDDGPLSIRSDDRRVGMACAKDEEGLEAETPHVEVLADRSALRPCLLRIRDDYPENSLFVLSADSEVTWEHIAPVAVDIWSIFPRVLISSSLMH